MVFAVVQQIANPPWPGPLAPQGKLQRPLPLIELGSAGKFHTHRRELKRPERDSRRHGGRLNQ